MHLKRSNIGNFWAVPKKGTKYLAVASHNQKDSIPLVVVMRDLLKIVRNKKELKKILNEKKIFINNKQIKETNYPVCLFDVIGIPSINKYYRMIISKNQKMILEEISEKESKSKIFKVINKKILPGKKIQLNLMHGRNLISTEKINIGGSIVLNLEDNKILKIIPMEKGKKVFVMKGKHAGIEGKVEEIMMRGGRKIAKIISEDKKINVLVKNLIIID